MHIKQILIFRDFKRQLCNSGRHKIHVKQNLGGKQMGKQTFDNMRKTLGILLLVLFIASLAAESVSAVSSVKYGSEKYDSYVRGYAEGYYKGYNDGFKDGTTGKDPRMFIMIYYGPDSGYNGGYFNGYKAGYGIGYTAGKKSDIL